MLDLEDLIPRESEFTLSATGKTYKVRPIALSDEIWIKKKYGAEITAVLKERNLEEISKIVFHLMTEESKADFTSRTVTFMNEEGESASEVRGGAALFMCLIKGNAEKVAIIKALLEVFGVSRPAIDSVMDTGEEKKRKKQTGAKSSTPSQPSTDGQPNTSSPEPALKSPIA
jgi:hypothetical protein